MNCSNGHECPENVAFCPTCGVAVAAATAPTQNFAYQAPAYQAPMNQVGYAQPMQMTTTNGLAIASMVLGICWVYWVGSILALIFGFVARKQIKERGQKGEGMAIAGIVLGFVGLATLIIVIIIAVAATNTTPQY